MIKIVAIGKLKEQSMQAMVAEYEKRLKPLCDIQMLQLNNSTKDNVADIIADESSRILEKITTNDQVILLDLKGKDFSSEEISEVVTRFLNTKDVVFVIGGSHGVNEAVQKRANLRWRFSSLTFPHQLVRVLLYEQVYRMLMIANHHPYHK